jgi:hypothetical protein
MGCPGSDPHTEQILIFGPDWEIQGKCQGKNRPVVLILRTDATAGCLLYAVIRGRFDRLD